MVWILIEGVANAIEAVSDTVVVGGGTWRPLAPLQELAPLSNVRLIEIVCRRVTSHHVLILTVVSWSRIHIASPDMRELDTNGFIKVSHC